MTLSILATGTLRRREVLAGLGAAPLVAASAPSSPVVRLETALGALRISLAADRAPRTVANFLAYVDRGLFVGGSFYRIVRADNDPSPHPIHVLQGGIMAQGDVESPLPPIPHESTAVTGLRHRDGVISMARGAPGTACSEFFICLGANPALDAGGRRNADGLGFAAFGQVVEGLEAFRALDRAPGREGPPGAPRGQWLAEPVEFRASRDL